MFLIIRAYEKKCIYYIYYRTITLFCWWIMLSIFNNADGLEKLNFFLVNAASSY